MAEEAVPKLIGHIEKVEEEKIEEDVEKANVVPTEDNNGEGCKTADKGTKAGKKEDPKKKLRTTPSAAKLKEGRRQVRIKEQERRWKEATEKGLGDWEGDIDLEDAMMSPDEGEKQTDKTKKDTEEGDTYGKVYTKTHEKRAERTMSRAEWKEQEEQRKKEEAAKEAAKAEADRVAQEEAKHIIERAQLKEEELAVQKRLEQKRKLQELAEEREAQEAASVSTNLKQQWKEKLGLKAWQCRREEEEGQTEARTRKRKCEVDEEDYVDQDDEDNDPDYNPTKDREQEYVEEDTYLDDEETFEIEKHVHAINLQEAGAYVV